jgi:hypothetical protein
MHERRALANGRFNASTMTIDGPHPMPGWGTAAAAAARHWLLFADDGEVRWCRMIVSKPS